MKIDVRYISFERISDNVIKIKSDKLPSEYKNGLLIYQGGLLLGDYSNYKTIYKVAGDNVWLSNDGSVCIPSIPPKPKTTTTITFIAYEGGTLEGDVEVEVKIGTTFGSVSIPTPKPTGDYEFKGWDREIDTSHVINHDEVYGAIFNIPHEKTGIGKLESAITAMQLAQAEVYENTLADITAVQVGIAELMEISKTP